MERGNYRQFKLSPLMLVWVFTILACIVVFRFMFSELVNIEKSVNEKNKSLAEDSTKVVNNNSEYELFLKDNPKTYDEIYEQINIEKFNENFDGIDIANSSDSNNEPNGNKKSDDPFDNEPSDNQFTDENNNNSQDEANSSDELTLGDESSEPKYIALTFDDGPFPSVTERVIDTLAKYNAKGTFFLVGYNVDYYPETVKKIYDHGFEIGNHTNKHEHLSKLSIEDAISEIDYVANRLNELVPIGDVILRPPYGDYNDAIRERVKVPLICWSLDSEDWKSRNAQTISEKILEEVSDGKIILMHDIYDTTADALELVLPKLVERGYKFVTVSELLREKGIEVEKGQVYR